MLMKRFGAKTLCIASAGLLGLLPLALGAAPDYPVALVIVCVDGVGVACLDVAMNAQGAELEERFERKAMGKLHATFSAGSLFGALLASAMNAATSSLEAHFLVAAVLLLLVLGYAQHDLLPRHAEAAETHDAGGDGGRRSRRRMRRLPTQGSRALRTALRSRRSTDCRCRRASRSGWAWRWRSAPSSRAR